MNDIQSTLLRVKILSGKVHCVLAVMHSGIETYRYLEQVMENDGIPFAVTYESTFSTSQSAKDYFDKRVGCTDHSDENDCPDYRS